MYKKKWKSRILGMLMCGGGLVGCAEDPIPTPLPPRAPSEWTQRISFWSPPDLNFGAPVPIDFVTVYNEDLAQVIRGLTAEQYFDRRGQLIRDFPDDVYIQPLEIVGGVFVPDITLTYPAQGSGATFVFALYRTPGEHRARVPTLPRLMVNLNEDDFEFRPLA